VSKYHNQPTNGYASKREAKRAFELQMLERTGQISDLKFQVPYEVIPAKPPEKAAFYVADFTYIRDGKIRVEDVKGVRTPTYILKRKLMWQVYGIAILET
jgi:hypothetical protein